MGISWYHFQVYRMSIHNGFIFEKKVVGPQLVSVCMEPLWCPTQVLTVHFRTLFISEYNSPTQRL
jgi:hypothetical protein